MPRLEQATEEAVSAAVQCLRRSGVVAFPTETVYGLGGDTFSVSALRTIYELKQRPADNPLIAHVVDLAMAEPLLADTSAETRLALLASRYWPGPLTIVVRKHAEVPDEATGGRGTIAIRAPRHPVAQRLLQSFNGPVSAPSANRSGFISPTTAQHVADDFADVRDLLILDGGQCVVGLESTVLDLTNRTPRILRPGAITAENLRDVLGDVESPDIRIQDASPGTRASHYAPRTPAALLQRDELVATARASTDRLALIVLAPLEADTPHAQLLMTAEPRMYAMQLYRALREADALDVKRILIERPPTDDDPRWAAVHDRLTRATGRSLGQTRSTPRPYS